MWICKMHQVIDRQKEILVTSGVPRQKICLAQSKVSFCHAKKKDLKPHIILLDSVTKGAIMNLEIWMTTSVLTVWRPLYKPESLTKWRSSTWKNGTASSSWILRACMLKWSIKQILLEMTPDMRTGFLRNCERIGRKRNGNKKVSYLKKKLETSIEPMSSINVLERPKNIYKRTRCCLKKWARTKAISGCGSHSAEPNYIVTIIPKELTIAKNMSEPSVLIQDDQSVPGSSKAESNLGDNFRKGRHHNHSDSDESEGSRS